MSKEKRPLTPEQLANLRPGLPENVDKGADGKFRPKAAKATEAELSEGRLEAINWVLRHPDEPPNTPLRKLYKNLYGDERGFLAEMTRLEEAAKESTKPAASATVSVWDGVSVCPLCNRTPPDEGTERIKGLIDRLMGEEP